MTQKYLFVVRYEVDGQARSIEVESEAESLTPEQARFHLESMHTSVLPAQITEVQVHKLADASREGAVGHQLQP